MKIEITRKIEKKEEIEIEFPFYYKHDLMLDEEDSIIYGKIEEREHTSIQISTRYGTIRTTSFELEIERCSPAHLGCYMEKKYKSNEAEFMKAKAEMLEAANKA